MEECRCTGKMLCGVVHRDSEHRIVSATIPIHAACRHGLTQGTAPEQCRQLKPTLPPYVLQIYPYVKPIRCSVMSRYPFEVPVWTND